MLQTLGRFDTEEQFLEVSVKVLPKLKITHVIGKAVWDQRGDIRV